MLEFFDLFWTAEGKRCIGRKTNIMQHFYFDTNEEANYFVEANKDKEGDLYFSPAVYAKAERNQANVKSIQAFWLDIDCGDGKDYPTQQEGLDALARFLKATSFPQPYIVSSGHGLHVYWVLQTPLAPSVWVGYAKQLKALCVYEGLKADPARTADSASLLRPVGTYNRKYGDNAQIFFIMKGQSCPMSAFIRLEAMAVDTGKNKEMLAGLDSEYPASDGLKVIEQCPLLADIAKKRGAVEEPLWRGMLSVISRCTGGEKMIHDLSTGDPRYNEAETAKKAAGTKGPYTCDQFASHAPDICKGCPFRGKITSPIVLGMPTKIAAPPEPEEKEVGKTQRVVKTEHFDVTLKGVLKRPLTEDDRVFYVTHVPVWVKSVREKVCHADEQGNSSLQIDWTDLGGRYHCAVLQQADLYDKKNFTKWLAENNLRALVKGEVNHMQNYITECILEIMKLQLVESYYENVGWVDDGFIIGRRCIKKGGVVPVSVQSSSSVANLDKKGSKKEWVEATSVFTDPRYWPHAFALLCSFASPLLELCKFQSAIISMTGASGYGKTLAASFALSIYGDPAHLTQPASTTLNAIGVQMAAQHNLPYLLDEVSTESGYKIADFIYAASNGREKEALDRNRNLKQGSGWCLVPFMTSNKSVLEMPESAIQEAHRRRIIETPFNAQIDTKSASTLATAMQDNYGTVADDYMTYVVENKDKIVSAVNSILETPVFKEVPPANRFGKWTIACAAIAGKIAEQLGLIKFSAAPVIQQVLSTLVSDASVIKDDVEIAKGALCAYLYQNNGSINIWSSKKDAVDQTLVRSVVARFDPATGLFYMQKELFSQVLRDAGVSLRNVGKWMKDNNIYIVTQRLGSSLPTVSCYSFSKEAIGTAEPVEEHSYL